MQYLTDINSAFACYKNRKYHHASALQGSLLSFGIIFFASQWRHDTGVLYNNFIFYCLVTRFCTLGCLDVKLTKSHNIPKSFFVDN